MPRARTQPLPARRQLAKSPTGIQGLDEITGGGLPKGRSTLVRWLKQKGVTAIVTAERGEGLLRRGIIGDM